MQELKGMDESRKTGSSGLDRFTYKFRETVATHSAHTGSSRDGPIAENGKGPESPTLTKKLSVLDICFQPKMHFPSGVSLGLLTPLQGRPYTPHPAVDGQQNKVSCGLSFEWL